ncbi:hypothetical protein GW17_00002779 [Ensete ventricosum]|nr:hypothetical protein GW17_00002779 [Ensete ventricosum]
MASCDDDFALLGDEAQSQHQPQARAVPFSAAHRYVTAKATPISLHPRTHHHLGAASSSAPSVIVSPGKKGVVVDGGGENHEGYGEAFGQTDASKCPSASAFHEHPCFAEDANPFATQHPADDDDDDGDADNPEVKGAATSASHHHHLQHLHHQQQPHHHSPKRKDRDDISDGESPYCYNSSMAANKKSRPMSSLGDYRKDREEWSDTAIGSLLDAYTERYEQLNRGNLRGRDWEDVATIVSERCNKQKVGKSVEQCKNKIDNLKKRYKVECQRLSSGGLPTSHWPWFKKMEQIVGSSSSLKAAPDDDKSVTLGGPPAGMRQIKRSTLLSWRILHFLMGICRICRHPISPSGPLSTNINSKMRPLSNPRWKRVILKISGMALAGAGPQNVDPKVIMLVAKEIAIASRAGLDMLCLKELEVNCINEDESTRAPCGSTVIFPWLNDISAVTTGGSSPLCVRVCVLRKKRYVSGRQLPHAEGVVRGKGRPLVQRTINQPVNTYSSNVKRTPSPLVELPVVLECRPDGLITNRPMRPEAFSPQRSNEKEAKRRRESDERERQKVYVSTAAAFEDCAVSIRFASREEALPLRSTDASLSSRVFPGQHPRVVAGVSKSRTSGV